MPRTDAIARREYEASPQRRTSARSRDRVRYQGVERRDAVKRAAWADKLWQRYGITVEQYDAKLVEQGGVCVVCGGVNPNGQRLHVDHDHATGLFRGLLCVRCNVKIGHLEVPVPNPIEMALYLGANLC